MVWTKYQGFVAVVLVATGSIKTISTKWANLSKAVGSDGKEPRKFQHPFVQACAKFLGELLCLLAFKLLCYHYSRSRGDAHRDMVLIRGNRDFNQLLLLAPTVCDMLATSVMYIGLILTYAASFQMLRGAVIVFVGLFSMCFLKRKLGLQEWGGIFLVILGLALVGLSDFLAPGADMEEYKHSTQEIIIGDLLIVVAQVLTATQMVLEEKYVAGLDMPPLQAVGWEGVFGFSTLSFLLFVFYFIPVPKEFSGSPRNVLEDAIDAFTQMYNNQVILDATLVCTFSIPFFTFAGISITKELSATTRKVLDSVRTLFIWMFTLAVGWQKFYWLQIVGFILLVTGTLVYNKTFAGIRELLQAKEAGEIPPTTIQRVTLHGSEIQETSEGTDNKPKGESS